MPQDPSTDPPSWFKEHAPDAEPDMPSWFKEHAPDRPRTWQQKAAESAVKGGFEAAGEASDFAKGFLASAESVGPNVLNAILGKQLFKPPEAPTTTAGKVGAGAEQVAETFLFPEVEATKVPKVLRTGEKVLRETLPSLAKRSAIQGAEMGVQAKAHGDDATVGTIFGLAGPGAARLLQDAAPPVSRAAEWLYQRALNPTKQITKAQTKEIVPELLERRYWASTWPRLKEGAENNLKRAGETLRSVEKQTVDDYAKTYVPTGQYRTVSKPGTAGARGPVIDLYGGQAAPPGAAKLPSSTEVGPVSREVGPKYEEGPGATRGTSERIYETRQGAFDLRPVLDRLRGMMRETKVRGKFPTRQAETLYGQLADQYQRLAQYGRYVNLRDAIQIRRILDTPLGEKGVFQLDPMWQSLDRVQRNAANTLRGLLNDNFPQLRAANREFHVWKTTTEIMEQTERRKVGQVGLIQTLATAGSLTADILRGGDVLTALQHAAMANAATEVLRSPGFQTLSAAQFQRLSDMLDRRDFNGFMRIAGVLLRPKVKSSDTLGGAPDADTAPPLSAPPP